MNEPRKSNLPGMDYRKPVSKPKPDLVSSESLLGTAGELCIQHRGEIYRLRITRSGKLILNK